MNTHRILRLPGKLKLCRTFHLIAMLVAVATAGRSFAEDWGLYSLIPVSAPALVIEAVDSGATEGTVVSLGKPAAAPNQKWIITPKGENLYSIRPSYSSTLVLAVEKGGVKNGTAIVLETDSGQPWQLWALTKQENGSYTLTPKHSPDKGLDDRADASNPRERIVCTL